MPNTYSQIYLQIVFSVRGRQNVIKEEFRDKLEKYISGIIANLHQKLYAIYCMPDHTHILVSVKPDIKVSDIVRDIKANSSRYLNENYFIRTRFQWQEGYGVFSYSHSSLKNVVEYVLNQKRYHQNKSFKEEYIHLLEAFQIDFNSVYLFEFYD